MPPRTNPLKLNPLQMKTLVLFQELARHSETATRLDSGEVFINRLPRPHGDHFHVGHRVALTRDASGLQNQAVWTALERKGLIRASFPNAVTLTPAGQDYDTGIAEQILHGSDH
jgi:ribosomal protein S19E (S16A)